MSHHLDSPLARRDPRLDIADLFLFPGTQVATTVVVIDTNPMSGTGGWHPEGRYECRIDTDGDLREDLVLRATFSNADAAGRQQVTLTRLDGARAREHGDGGEVLARGWSGELITSPSGIRLWAGPAVDPFFIDGATVTAIVQAIEHGAPPVLPDPAAAVNAFAGTTVQSIVLELPDALFEGASRIGVWGVTTLPHDDGGWEQIQRAGTPLINTLFNPDHTAAASAYNLTHPEHDLALHGPHLAHLMARLAEAMGVDQPAAHGEQVVGALLPDVLGYRPGTKAYFTAKERNGRPLGGDDAAAMFALVLGRQVRTGLDSSSAGMPSAHFPYVPAAIAT